jgi:hypothetical protein
MKFPEIIYETKLYANFEAVCVEEGISTRDVFQLLVVTGMASFLITIVIMQLSLMT